MKTVTEPRAAKIQEVAAQRTLDIVLVLEDVNDPHNAAAIIRSCDGLGIQRVILIFEHQKAWDPRIVGRKASAYTVKWMDFEVFDSTKESLVQLKKEGFTICATHLDEGAQSFNDFDFAPLEKIALVLGNEHRGISSDMMAGCDHRLYIQMKGFCESLNVSVAAAIGLWEITSQWIKCGKLNAQNKDFEAVQKSLLAKSKSRRSPKTKKNI